MSTIIYNGGLLQTSVLQIVKVTFFPKFTSLNETLIVNQTLSFKTVWSGQNMDSNVRLLIPCVYYLFAVLFHLYSGIVVNLVLVYSSLMPRANPFVLLFAVLKACTPKPVFVFCCTVLFCVFICLVPSDGNKLLLLVLLVLLLLLMLCYNIYCLHTVVMFASYLHSL